MKVSKIKITKQETASQDEDIFNVSKKMKFNKSIVILNKRKPVGIITMRDIVTRVLAKGKDPKKVLAKDVMTKPVFCAKESDDVTSIIKTMIEKDYMTVPVINKNNEYRGILTLRNLIHLKKSLKK